MYTRWRKLRKEFYKSKRKKFDLSKIPDIYDCVKFDIMHNQHLLLRGIDEAFNQAKALADVVIPQEYGVTAQEKRWGVVVVVDVVVAVVAIVVVAAAAAVVADCFVSLLLW